MNVREGFSTEQSRKHPLQDRIFSYGPVLKTKNYFKKGFVQVAAVLAFFGGIVGVASATSGSPSVSGTISDGAITLQATGGGSSLSASVTSDGANTESSDGTEAKNSIKITVNGQQIDASGGNVHKVIKDGSSQTTIDVQTQSNAGSSSSNSVNITSHSSTIVNGQEAED